MPLNNEEILAAVDALETIAKQAALVPESEILTAMSQIRTHLQTIVDASDRIAVLEHLLRESNSFQDWISENLPKTSSHRPSDAAASASSNASAEISRVSMIKVCVLLVALYEQNKGMLKVNQPQHNATNNNTALSENENTVATHLQRFIFEKLYHGGLSTKGLPLNLNGISTSLLVFGVFNAFLGPLTAGLTVLPFPAYLLASQAIKAIGKTQDTYKEKCDIIARMLCDMLLRKRTTLLGHDYTQMLSDRFVGMLLERRNYPYVLLAMTQNVNNFTVEGNGNAARRIYINAIPDNIEAFQYQTTHSNGIQMITREEFASVMGEPRTVALFTALSRSAVVTIPAEKEKILKPFLKDILRVTALRGHSYDSHNIRRQDIRLLKIVIMSAVLNIKDPSVQFGCLMDMLDETTFVCKLMDIDRQNRETLTLLLTILALIPQVLYNADQAHLAPYHRLREHRTDKGIRTGILDNIDKAMDGCVAQFLNSASILPPPLRQALHTHQLNQFVKELNLLLDQYENAKTIDSLRSQQVIKIRMGIQQAYADGITEPHQALNTLMQLVSEEQYAAQKEHQTKNFALYQSLVKPQSQLSCHLENARKWDMKRRFSLLSNAWTPEVAYLFLQLSCSFIRNEKNKKAEVYFPLHLITEITAILTGLSKDQTGILWKQYGAIFPKSPVIQRLTSRKGKLIETSGIYANVSASLSKELDDQKQQNSIGR